MTHEGPAARVGIITKLSPRPVADTISRLTSMITDKGMKLFAVIDQAAEAAHAGLQLRDTTLVIFGSPAAGTPVMQASPLAALDLPLKVLIWDDDARRKSLTQTPPGWQRRLSAAVIGTARDVGEGFWATCDRWVGSRAAGRLAFAHACRLASGFL